MQLDQGLIDRSIQLRSWVEAQSQDKLALWRFAVSRLRDAFRLFTGPDPIDEVHLRGPNKGTKTNTSAAYVLACVQKRKELDGAPVPQWKGRVEAVQAVLDYKRQILSVQAAYLKHLEGWTFKPRYVGEALAALRVKPDIDEDIPESEWGLIHFVSQENKRAGVGVRADVVAFDEPPVMEILRELRKAAHAGRRGIRIIAETPEHMKEWAELREDYGETPRRSLRRVDKIRAECRWSLDEVEDWVLSPAEKARMWESYKNDPLFGEDGGARWHGDYTNVVGSTPWGKEGLLTLFEMLNYCTPPEIRQVPVQVETSEGEPAETTTVSLQVWKKPQPNKLGYLDVDPSSGQDDGKHHEAALHQSEQGTGDLCARWAGYLAPFSLGSLSASVARQYNDSPIDIETMDHWGINVVRGVQASRYGNFAYEQRELTPGKWATETGFKNDEKAKAIHIGCIQEWLAVWGTYFEARRQGRDMSVPYAFCPSREVIQTLIDAELDEKGKVIAGPGLAHGHDMILWGQKLRKAVSRSNREIPQMWERPKTSEEKLVSKIMGKDESNGFRPPPMKPRRAPRI